MQKSPLKADFLCSAELAEPPNFALEHDADKVNKPKYGDTYENKNDRKNDAYEVVCINALENAVNCPENIECGKCEYNLHDKRKIINGFNEIFHYKPPKNIFSGKRAFTCYIIHHKQFKSNNFFLLF
jgi:hypothetical protein